MARLPLNCTIDYLADFLNPEEANELYRTLTEDYHLDKEKLVVEAAGKMVETDSYKILFSTAELIAQNTHPQHIHGKCYPWAGAMDRLRQKVEDLTGQTFEIAMCLFYPDGNYFAPYHSDQMTSGEATILPSLSLGEVRKFEFRENDNGGLYSLDLDHGSLLVMGRDSQTRYQHSLPRDPGYQRGRINITFREASFK
ncbi:alpha-ketoglutarate-dependent dioxygenase AlkB [Verrucomicrobiaceae bacterium 227]